MPKHQNEKFSNNNTTANANNSVNDMITNLSVEYNISRNSIVAGIIIVLVISLSISILLTVLGNKARAKCAGSSKFSLYSPLILTFLILMWLGSFLPGYGTAVHVVGFIGAIVMIVNANKQC